MSQVTRHGSLEHFNLLPSVMMLRPLKQISPALNDIVVFCHGQGINGIGMYLSVFILLYIMLMVSCGVIISK